MWFKNGKIVDWDVKNQNKENLLKHNFYVDKTFFENSKHMLKLVTKKKVTFLCSQSSLNWTIKLFSSKVQISKILECKIVGMSRAVKIH